MPLAEQPVGALTTAYNGAELAEVELTGCFLLRCVDEECSRIASCFPGALIFQAVTLNAKVSSCMIVMVTESSRPNLLHSLPVVLKGHFLSSTLRKSKVFEANAIVPVNIERNIPVQIPLNTNCLLGTVLFVSQCFKLKRGLTAFVVVHERSDVRSDPGRNVTTVLLLSGDALRCSPYLSRGITLQIDSPIKTRLPPATGATDDTLRDFLLVDHSTQLNIHVLQRSTTDEAYQVDGHIPLGVPLLSRRDLLYPRSVSFKDIISAHEFDVRGEVLHVHPEGWIELVRVVVTVPAKVMAQQDLHYPCAYPFIVNTSSREATMEMEYCALYLSHSEKHLRTSAISVSIRRGARIAAMQVMPVYLWTKLKGFALTSRSQLGIDRFSPNKMLQSDDGTYSALMMKVPTVLHNSCQMYTAWRAEISHKLQQATGKRLHEFPTELSSHFSHLIESFAAFDDGDSTGSCSGLLQLVIRAGTAVDPSQLFDPRYIALFVIRNGFDSDWLSGRFPQVWTLRDIALKMKAVVASIVDRDSRRGASAEHRVEAHSLHSHYIDLFQTIRSSSTIISGAHSPTAEHRVLIVGALQYVHLPQQSVLGIHDTDLMTINVSIKDYSSGDVTWMVIRCSSDHKFFTSVTSQLLSLRRLHLHDPGNCKLKHLEHHWRCGIFHDSHAPLDPDVGPQELCLCHLPASRAPVVVVRRAVCLLEEGPNAQSYSWRLVAEGSDVRFVFPHQYESISVLQMEAARGDAPRGGATPAAVVSIPSLETAHLCWSEEQEVDPLSICSTGGEGDCSSNALELTPSQFPVADVLRGDPVGVRALLTMMGGRRLQRIAECIGVVTSKQLLSVATGKDRKRKRSSSEAAAVAYGQCSVVLRDLARPDCVKVYLPASWSSGLPVGAVVLLRDWALTLPETKKKLYLQQAVDWGSRIEFLGMLRLPVLQELCAVSRSRQSDPRSICTTSDVLDTTPVTTIRLLQSMKEADRCLWTLRGQVVFVKRLKVSLRCRTCKVRASPLPNRCDCVFSCSRCHSQLSLFPLWEASIAFDDGTGECNLSVEDQAVFSFIRSRFDDPRGAVLADVKVMVDEYVHRRGMLEYDSYERSDVSNSKSKPYQWLVDEEAERVDAGPGPLQEEKKKKSKRHGAAVFEVLQLPEEEKGRRSGMGMVPSFDLKENPDGVHAVDVLRAYLELGSCCNNLEVTCILSNSSSGCGGGSSSSGATMRTRDLKVQKNNEVDRPYLASFEMRPVGVDSRKLSMDCYAVRELKGSRLIDRIRSMMGNVP